MLRFDSTATFGLCNTCTSFILLLLAIHICASFSHPSSHLIIGLFSHATKSHNKKYILINWKANNNIFESQTNIYLSAHSLSAHVQHPCSPAHCIAQHSMPHDVWHRCVDAEQPFGGNPFKKKITRLDFRWHRSCPIRSCIQQNNAHEKFLAFSSIVLRICVRVCQCANDATLMGSCLCAAAENKPKSTHSGCGEWFAIGNQTPNDTTHIHTHDGRHTVFKNDATHCLPSIKSIITIIILYVSLQLYSILQTSKMAGISQAQSRKRKEKIWNVLFAPDKRIRNWITHAILKSQRATRMTLNTVWLLQETRQKKSAEKTKFKKPTENKFE